MSALNRELGSKPISEKALDAELKASSPALFNVAGVTSKTHKEGGVLTQTTSVTVDPGFKKL
jgi:hypothetical protein